MIDQDNEHILEVWKRITRDFENVIQGEYLDVYVAANALLAPDIFENF